MVKRILRVLDSHQKNRLYMLLVMILGGAILETVGVSAILPLVSAVVDPTIIDDNKYFSFVKTTLGITDNKKFILVMSVGLIVIYIVKNIYLILLNVAQNHFTTNNQRRLSTRLMSCYMNQPYLYHTEHNVAELERNVDLDVGNYMYVVNNILLLATEALVCGMLSVYLVIKDPFTTLLMVAMLGVFMIFFVKVVRKRLKYYGLRSRELTGDKNRTFLESFGGVKEVKAASKEKYFIDKYDRIFKDYAINTQRQQSLTYMPRPIMESLCICGILLFMSIRIAIGVDVNTFIPVMSVFAVAAIRMLPSFNRISGYLSALMFNKASVDAIYEDLLEVKRLEENTAIEKDDIDINVGDINLKNVSFAYPAKKDKLILDDVSLTIPKNKSVAFVGPSGAGKTTAADIILGVLTPQKGQVSVGGVNVLEHLSTWHSKVGYIPQSTFLTDDTIRANVAFGVPGEDIDDEKIWKALEAAQIADFVRQQEDGIYSNIGDRGVKISGGQRQRLGIARALYNDPEVIVLDEATSALDNETETAVMDAIYSLSGKKTMIIIAHRLSTIQKCDLIYEISGGKAKKKEYDQL